ncbi:hypothetical protein HanXRQr2_Chr01g0020611 [Helianthus annuus]|uniref:Uncharacterized protein n=1 Tax=Helianthus annuus TaxID=4232 RepID=A0A251VN38_HELAN|nr:hypothetical protein HanXRQr2_Chr01g0020611 [Helianthus annuus]KAJ0611531.1 hypothetical protein HanHA300_Chr01g0016831 [Helianthus annuus]KAJ0622585.1 hypothetical protein HanIR_Chr01g0022311 [Helianthus annuus]KAJ0626823.1 hypothetical protein HanHA89_Chr01g0018381 [Helianthus annuus]KAJ0783169.1 hypothetical protein HanLR1_Chr01g0017291 [Helianthus annuus]
MVVIDPFVNPITIVFIKKYLLLPLSLTTAPAVMISGGNGAGYSTTTIYASSVSSSVTNIPPTLRHHNLPLSTVTESIPGELMRADQP